jgi:hypothetical protein
MKKQKLNFTIGRFQPFTQGHVNMIEEVDGDCLVFQMIPPGIPEKLKGLKSGGRTVKKEDINIVLDYLNGNEVYLDKCQKELTKRPFTNELINKELDIIKKNNEQIIDVIYVKTLFDGIGQFNKYLLDNYDKYECGSWLCGDDRKDEYQELIDKYITPGEDIAIAPRSEEKYQNVISSMTINIGNGRKEGLSGTDVRNAIITKDKSKFVKAMPNNTDIMFDELISSFDEFKDKLRNLIKENQMMSLKDYILENLNQGE